ncbi:hypothetical protein E2542_SST17624 [Spatholobus suberectus]|nr:hypothetical protein E2542_SST17624 [Spatholobus suberectus]
MGVAGMQQKQIVLSVGKDENFGVMGTKGVFGLMENNGMEGDEMDGRNIPLTPERQLRLFDIRSKGTELHAFGWKQESSESQSALINQAWSPNGLYITSGSADPMIHIFDIRYNGHKPSL